jgi:hypothetical protein
MDVGHRSYATSAPSRIHVAARPAYSGVRPGRSSAAAFGRNNQSQTQTTIGAVTIVCLLPMPAAQATMAPAIHQFPAPGWDARIEQ